MSVWKYEMKKMFIFQKGLLFIILFIILTMASMISLDRSKNPDIEMNASSYSFYLKQVQGSYHKNTEQFFASEADKISNAKVALQEASDRYYDGKMGKDEFLAVTGPMENVLEHEKGFKLIYDQYTYIREHPANRYFMYTNGWDGLLANENLDLLWVVLLLLLITPVFCFEYESKMDTLLLTVQKGTRYHAICKISLVFLTVLILSLAIAGIKYGFYQYKYGLFNGNYPLQSLPYFGTSTKESSLNEAFMWIMAGKLFGSLCFAMLILFVSVCLRKYAITLFVCTALILIPYYGLRLESTKYLLPGPLAFMVSTGFLRGNEYKNNPFKDQMELIFREVSLMSWSIVFVVTVCLSIGMFVVILIRRTNVWNSGLRNHGRKVSTLTLILCMMVTLLSGCNSAERSQTSDSYNYSSKQSFENSRYLFKVDETDLKAIRLVFIDKQTGEKRNFVRNPMPSLTRVENTIFGNGNDVYYMKYDSDKSGVIEDVTRFSIIEVDTTSFKERIIFEKKLSTDKSMILGLSKSNNQDANFYLTISSFFLDEHSLYFIGQNEIHRVDRLTGKMTVILKIPASTNVAFDGRMIYYVNDKSQMVKYDTNTDSEMIIPDLITRFFILTDTELLFLNRKDQQKMYSMSLHDLTLRKITGSSVQEFHCDKQYIYYVNKSDLQKHRMDINGENNILQ
ncbi:DUF5050 domain-containing protein [Paenibacillus pini]|uniref:Prolow-density lipoprotein receptor-related protein 1-like beta-propeller domain-containing protein n=1 Tax=Paenibacillus pini JCM 16418 TaxID=1236976 RepID=W7YNY9_9BACL|nr:DUF5050 domain-containing protein [Paenibacillus pini]GAF09323.1 hypothetical protein JCM16418_3460 [Paenibacillus pini JCM 16418]